MIEIRERPFEPYAELKRFQEQAERLGQFGATVSFVGTVRDFNDDRSVERVVLEYYPGMTERELQRMSDDAQRRWAVLDTLILHRVGALSPSDPIVLVVAWAVHRAPAFEACRFLIEELKQRAPFWKKESDGTSERWVTHNTPG